MQGALPLCLLCTQLAAAAMVPRHPSRCGACRCLTADALLAPQKSLLPWPHKPVENTRDGTTSMVRWALLTLVAAGETVKVRADVCRKHIPAGWYTTELQKVYKSWTGTHLPQPRLPAGTAHAAAGRETLICMRNSFLLPWTILHMRRCWHSLRHCLPTGDQQHCIDD